MKKKSILGRIGIVAAALTLATTSMMSGTLARYQTISTLGTQAIVAKWSAKVTDNSSKPQEIKGEVDLAATMLDNGVDKDKVGNSTTAAIAPGTKGSKSIIVDVTGSEVPITMEVTATNKYSTGSGTAEYVFPEHLKVWITDAEGNQVGDLKASWDEDEGQYENPFKDGDVDLIGGSSATNKPLLFKSAKESNAVQKKTYTINWEWPLDRTESAKEDDTTAYNATDMNYAGGSKKFGFGLTIKLSQADKTVTGGTEGTDYVLVK